MLSAQEEEQWSQHANPKAKRDMKREEQVRVPYITMCCHVAPMWCAYDAIHLLHDNPCLRQERQREEAAKKKAEVKRLAAEEEAEMAAAAKKKAPKAAPKVRLGVTVTRLTVSS